MRALERSGEDGVGDENSESMLNPFNPNGFPATPSPIRFPEFRSFRIGRSFGLDITGVGETMRLQLMCCTLSNLSSSQFTKGRIKE